MIEHHNHLSGGNESDDCTDEQAYLDHLVTELSPLKQQSMLPNEIPKQQSKTMLCNYVNLAPMEIPTLSQKPSKQVLSPTGGQKPDRKISSPYSRQKHLHL